MSVKKKVFIAKVRRFNEVGPIDMMAQRTKDTLALVILDAIIWTVTISLIMQVFTPNVIRIQVADAAVVTAGADSGTTRGEVIKTTHEEETRKESTPQPSNIEELIRKEFGKDAENALRIARCESHLNPKAHGDLDLTYEKNGNTYGDSIGIFQVRTFENRPTREQLRSAEFNIKYAKKLFDAAGDFSPWYNCARMNGLM